MVGFAAGHGSFVDGEEDPNSLAGVEDGRFVEGEAGSNSLANVDTVLDCLVGIEAGSGNLGDVDIGFGDVVKGVTGFDGLGEEETGLMDVEMASDSLVDVKEGSDTQLNMVAFPVSLLGPSAGTEA